MAKVSELPKKAAPADSLTTFDVTDQWTRFGDGVRYNPDDLVGKKGLPIYAKMLTDEQVKAATDFKLAAIMARGYEFKFGEGVTISEDEQKSRKSIMMQIVNAMSGSFDTAIENVASGREFGFSVSEQVGKDITLNGRIYRGIDQIVLRDPASFQFVADMHGQLLRTEQRIGTTKPLVVPQEKIIHYVHRPKWDQFYGRSELRSAYRWWYIKEQVAKMWPIYLEKYGGGFGIASKTTDSAPRFNSPEHMSLETALKNIKAMTSIIVPQGVEFNLVFPGSSDMYEKCLQFCDLAIAKSQLVPNLLGLSNSGQTGAYSQSQTQFESFLWTIKSDSTALADCINEQLIYALGEANWGDDQYPYLCFKPASFDHVKWMLETWQKLLTTGAAVASEEDERYIRSLLEMPERKPDEVLRDPLKEEQIARDQAVAMQKAQQPAAAGTAFSAELAELRVMLTTALNAQRPHEVTINNSPAQELTAAPAPDSGSVVPHGDLFGIPLPVFDRAAERVNFAVVDKQTEGLAVHYVRDLAMIIAKATKFALGNDERMSQLIDSDTADVASVDVSGVDRGKLRKSFQDMLSSAWTLGSNLASNEIDRAKKQATPELMRREKFASLRNKAADYFANQSFRMAGDTSDQTKKIIQTSLQNAVKFGKTIIETRVDIWDALVAKGLTSRDVVNGIETDKAVNAALDALWLESEESVTPYLNTLVRTNTFEALNEARFAEFTDPALSDFVLALRYAAVLDSSTTEICQALNGSVFKADSDLWNTYRPPNHFNCRSVLVPITAIDGWDGIESEQPDVQPQDGFK